MVKGKNKIKEKTKVIKEIELPEGVTTSLDGQLLIVKGPKGEVKRQIKKRDISITIGDKKVVFESENDKKLNQKMIGSLTAHLKNMIKGSSQNHVYTLKICSGHFPMNV
ncbi:MAG: 50S ribosomal protein L6, partial [Candidatus Woesearchaeota archaeon]|nr:50S ribosomal protein L6 [Candidatus Woesearchaeota archaeon]